MVEAWRGEADACHAAAARAQAVGARRQMPLPAVYAVYAEALLATALESRRRGGALRDAARHRAARQPDLGPRPRRRLRARRAPRGGRERGRALRGAGPGKRVAPAVAARMRGQLATDPAAAEAAPARRGRAARWPSRPAGGGPHAARARRGAGRRRPARGRPRAAARGDRPLRPPGARPWAERARRRLRAAGAVARAAVETAAGAELTPHEQRIAQLVAQGLTNRETAAALFVSTRRSSTTCATCSASSACAEGRSWPARWRSSAPLDGGRQERHRGSGSGGWWRGPGTAYIAVQ